MVCDDDLTFLMHVYQDVVMASQSLRSLRAVYPRARVIVISDGDPDPRIQDLTVAHGARFVPGERLYVGRQNIGKYPERMLLCFLDDPTALLVKIDPDTRVLRRFTSIPPGLLYGGTIEHRSDDKKHESIDPPNVQGGCMVIAKSLAEMLVAPGVLRSPRWERRPEKTWLRFSGAREAYDKTQKLLDDLLLSYVVDRLGVPFTDWDEVWSHWTTKPDEEARRRAIVHKWDWSMTQPGAGL